jgi:hypothetical protein
MIAAPARRREKMIKASEEAPKKIVAKSLGVGATYLGTRGLESTKLSQLADPSTR